MPLAVTREEATIALNFLHELGPLARSRSHLPITTTYVTGKRTAWIALTRFLCNPYWNRAWIMQEIARGRRVSILYGGYHIDWMQLRSFFEIFDHEEVLRAVIMEITRYELRLDQIKYTAIGQVRALSALRDRVSRSDLPGIVEAMKTTTRSEATDPRDKVYALYSLIARDQRIVPDYSLSAEDVYVEIAQAFQNTKPASMLEFAGIGYERKFKDLPSWAPDWTMLPTKRHEQEQYATGSSRYHAGGSIVLLSVQLVHELGPRLHLVAAPISQLRLLSDPFRLTNLFDSLATQGSSIHAKDLQYWILNAIIMLVDNMPRIYPRTGQFIREAIWRTLIGDCGQADQQGSGTSLMHPAPYAPYARLYDIYVDEVVPLYMALVAGGNIARAADIAMEDLGVDAFMQKFTEFVLAVASACTARRVAITDDKTIALVPELAEDGDWLCVVPGLAFPVILRKVPENGNSSEELWQFVGDSYAHGLMAAEAIDVLELPRREFTLI